jgi:hypothetical protein
MSELRDAVQQLHELVMAQPTSSRLLDIAVVTTLGAMVESLETLDAGLQLHADALTVVARSLARHAQLAHHTHEGGSDATAEPE